MKPVKPKKMPKAVLTVLERTASSTYEQASLSPHMARAILAALEYERQRADKAEGIALAAVHARVSDAVASYDATFQREQTAAVVPPKRRRRG